MPKIIFSPSEGYWCQTAGWVRRPDKASELSDAAHADNITMPDTKRGDAIMVPAERCTHLSLYDVCKALKLTNAELEEMSPLQLFNRYKSQCQGELFEDGEGGYYCLETSDVLILPTAKMNPASMASASGVYEGPEAHPVEEQSNPGLLPEETTALEDATDIAGLFGAFMKKHGARQGLDLLTQGIPVVLNKLGKNHHRATLPDGEHIHIHRERL